MNIVIDVYECYGSTGQVRAVQPTVNINVDIDRNYNHDKLRILKTDIQNLLFDRLNDCIDNKR